MFTESFLRRLETLTLATRRRAHGQLKGVHRSPRVGSGMVFADFRPYTPKATTSATSTGASTCGSTA